MRGLNRFVTKGELEIYMSALAENIEKVSHVDQLLTERLIEICDIVQDLTDCICYMFWIGRPPRVYQSLWWPTEKGRPQVITRWESISFPGLDSLIITKETQ